MSLLSMFTDKIMPKDSDSHGQGQESLAHAVMGMGGAALASKTVASLAPEMLGDIKSAMGGMVTGGHDAGHSPPQFVGSAPARSNDITPT